MKTTKLFVLSLSLLLTLAIGGCKKAEIKTTTVTVELKNPSTLQDVLLKSAEIKFKEVNSGSVTTAKNIVDNKVTITLPEGAYDITFEGEIEHSIAEGKILSKVSALKQGVILSGFEATTELDLFLFKGSENFVIKEVFFTGTVTPEGKTYNGDKYFIIHNNSDKVLYADSLIIAESDFLTTSKVAYTPNVMTTDFTSRSIVMIPGTGTTYPIQPGKSFVVANNAINHLEYNANSVDLRNAEFEITLLSAINVDNPQVTDLTNIVGTMTMHNRGFKSYVIAKMKGSVTGFLAANVYDYTYLNAANNTTKVTAYKIPNSWILDAVNLSVASEFNWIVTSPQLDMGWTFCGKTNSDATRYGKSVVRKTKEITANGRIILQDTNNSTDDFNAESKPTLFK